MVLNFPAVQKAIRFPLQPPEYLIYDNLELSQLPLNVNKFLLPKTPKYTLFATSKNEFLNFEYAENTVRFF